MTEPVPGGLSAPLNLSSFGAPAVQDNPEDVWEEDWTPGKTHENESLDYRQYRGAHYSSAHYVPSPDVQSPGNWQQGGSANIAGVDAETWQDENNQTRHIIGEYFETSTPISQGKSESLITHTSYDLSPHSSSIGGVYMPSAGNFSLYSPHSQPFRSDIPATTIPMHLGTIGNISYQVAPAQSGWRDTPVAGVTMGQTSGVYGIHGGQAVGADGMIYPLKSDSTEVPKDCSIRAQDTGGNIAGQTIGAHGMLDYTGLSPQSTPGAITVSPGSATSATTGEESGSTYSDKVARNLNPDEKKVIIKEKRFLEKKLLGIEKLQKKRSLGAKLTKEETVKVEKRFHFERQLEALLDGINLDD